MGSMFCSRKTSMSHFKPILQIRKLWSSGLDSREVFQYFVIFLLRLLR